MASELNIGTRLETIVDLCPSTNIVADIGCDHGYVAAELVLQNKVKKVIATDISPASLNKAVRFCNSLNINYYISFREGNGFDAITKYDKIDVAIIAGIGGEEIINIIEKGKKKKVKEFILQPMSDVENVRQYLINNRYNIVYDYLVEEEGMFYNILRVTKKKFTQYSNLELLFGKDNFNPINENIVRYLEEEKIKLEFLKSQVNILSDTNQLKLDNIISALDYCYQQENRAEGEKKND